MRTQILAIAAVVYVVRWPIQVACAGLAVRRLTQHRRPEALRWAVAGTVALVAPWALVLVAQPMPNVLRGVIAAFTVALVVLLFRRGLARAARAGRSPVAGKVEA